MKVLYIHKKEPDEKIKKMIALQSKEHDVQVVKLYDGRIDYDELMRLIFSCDRVISW